MQASGQNRIGSQSDRLKNLSCSFSIDLPISILSDVAYMLAVNVTGLSAICRSYEFAESALQSLPESVEIKKSLWLKISKSFGLFRANV
jgi:hypothetical protein